MSRKKNNIFLKRMNETLEYYYINVFSQLYSITEYCCVFGWDLLQTNVIINEEEPHSLHLLYCLRKTLPKPLDVLII
jgi:hypothetical protein